MKVSFDTNTRKIEVDCNTDAELADVLEKINTVVKAVQRSSARAQRTDSTRKKPAGNVKKILTAMVENQTAHGTPSEYVAHALDYSAPNALGPASKVFEAELDGTGLTLDDIRTIKRTPQDGAFWKPGPRFEDALQYFKVEIPSSDNANGAQLEEAQRVVESQKTASERDVEKLPW